EWHAGRPLERLGHGRNDPVAREDVALAREVRPGHRGRDVDALCARVRSGASVGGHHTDLPLRAEIVASGELGDDLLRLEPSFEEVEPPSPVRDLRERLRRNSPHAAARPRHHRGAREELRLHGDPDLVRLRVGGGDRERHVRPARTVLRMIGLPLPVRATSRNPARSNALLVPMYTSTGAAFADGSTGYPSMTRAP